MDKPDKPAPFIKQVEQALEPNWQMLKVGEPLRGANDPAAVLLRTIKAGLARYEGDPSAEETSLSPEARSGDTRFYGLAKLNKERGALRKIAQQTAKQLWQNDTAQKIRIGEMAQSVFAELYKEHRKLLPDKPDQIKDWIRSAAPAYALQPGRPKKTP
ncbi:hypothetical protein [Pseudomonas sp. P8_241]|uniref:hypothetical protein n=1 Tax=Pseudomonas sp. P8_241 TaxID=3043445 RepID=UPI002A36FF7F|nr:hypothetical protein [Pseudomonas sp. P8_241]WPN47509.1 hypothetical protein QMK58_02175 [Pseudomonas sp. P8_241]